MEILITILTSTAVSGICVVIVETFFKRKIEHKFDIQLEEHKKKLDKENEIEITKLRADLEIAAAERNFRFSHVFGDTAETIKEMFRILIDLRDALHEVTLHVNPQPNAEAILRAKQDSAWGFFERNRILIPKDQSKMVMKLLSECMDLRSKYDGAKIMQGSPLDTLPLAQKRGAEIAELVRNIELLIDGLTDSFQKTLGLSVSDKK